MKSTSLESKTIRPGLGTYSFYHSDRHPAHIATTESAVAPKKGQRGRFVIVALIALVGLSALAFKGDGQKPAQGPQKSSAVAAVPAQAAPEKAVHQCDSNSLAKVAIIDITDRRLYACEGTKQVHVSAVITGMEQYVSTLTPPGTYKIYAKQRDTVLSGSDESGAWSRPVSYWMPFLDNEHGTYGFHDATWRKDAEFGNVDPNSDKASHGCVELPIASSAWLYDWAEVGTTITVQT